MQQGRITLEQIIDKCHTRPAAIFGLPTDDDTYIEVDMSERIIKDEELLTKCGWSPFAGQAVNGRVVKVVIRGKTFYEKGAVIATAGSGSIIGASA